MKALGLKLVNFRNIESCNLQFCEESNVIYGENAQGKTNILESLFLCTGSKGFRHTRDSDLISFEKDSALVSLDFFSNDRKQKIDIKIGRQEKRKKYLLNGVEKTRVADTVSNFSAVLFSPEHLNLVKEGPLERRTFLDVALCHLKPRYITALAQYNRVLRQKNALLKDAYKYLELRESIDVWNERQANLAAYIAEQRESYIKQLLETAARVHQEISREKEKLELSYKRTAEGCAEDIYKKLCELKKEEVKAGVCLIGPHRDDMEININGKAARGFASQGQQRSAVLSIKTAECEVISTVTEQYPVLLLDDIMSELDKKRQDFVYNHLKGHQVVITTCDVRRLRYLNSGKRFKVSGGVLEEK